MSESDVDLGFQMYIPTGQTLTQIFFGTEDVKLVDQKQLMRDLFSGKRTQAEVKQEAKRLVKIQQKVDETFKPEAQMFLLMILHGVDRVMLTLFIYFQAHLVQHMQLRLQVVHPQL